jgi:FixJ family two-component response regulator
VAVVDDSESVRESLSDLLRQLRYDVLTYSSAEEFLASGVRERTSCIVLDVGLPGLSGSDLQRELRRDGGRSPIVFITADPDKSLHLRLLAAGAVAVLLKPFSDTALLEAITNALGRR